MNAPLLRSGYSPASRFVYAATGFWPIAVGTVFLSSILGYGTITLPYMTAAFPADMKGTGLGLLRTFYMTIGAASPALFGVLADNGFFDEGYVVLAGFAVVAMVLVYWLPDVSGQ